MRKSRTRRLSRAALAVMLACALALVGATAAVAAGGAGGDEGVGSTLLSIKLKRTAFDNIPSDDAVLDDAEGELDEARQQQTAGPTTLAIKLRSATYHTVTFVEYYVDDEGGIEQEGAGPHRHIYTVSVADARTASPRDEVPEGRWMDGWFRADPAEAGTTDASALGERVDFASERIRGDVTFYGMLKTGFTLYLDGNGGATAPPGYVSLARDMAYEEACGNDPDAMARPGVAFGDETPRAGRAGYDFCGWYWPELTSDGKVQADPDNGGVLLANRDGDPALGLDADGAGTSLTYGEMLRHRGETLYAKWEVAKTVRIRLAGAKAEPGASGDDGLFLWFWPGRGYATADPAADPEAAEASLLAAPGPVDLAFEQLPFPQYATQYFAGWGVPDADASDEGDYLIRSDKEGDAYTFALAERAFGGDYVDDTGGGMAWVGPAEDDGTGQLEATWDVVYKTARISVRAPFEVTFKERSDGGRASAEELASKGIGELEAIYSDPFATDGLEGKAFVESPQEFANTSGERDVYISAIECVNVGAGAILPGGQTGAAIFSLAERPQGALGPFPIGGTTIGFGYAGGAAQASVDRARPETWIELPHTDRETGEEHARVLWYGLDLATAGFDRTKVAFGGEGASYVAKVANVKYTYSVVP